uniref:SUEL-type lectin domain-containing protein n=1 Tax=Anas platyrhynchos platyrhynchos TaxID=8840 RepID=A0A493U196_ANAPP
MEIRAHVHPGGRPHPPLRGQAGDPAEPPRSAQLPSSCSALQSLQNPIPLLPVPMQPQLSEAAPVSLRGVQKEPLSPPCQPPPRRQLPRGPVGSGAAGRWHHGGHGRGGPGPPLLACRDGGQPRAWRVPTQGAEEPHHPHVRRGAAPHPLPSQDHHQHPGRLLRAPRAQPQPLSQPGQCVPGEHRVHVPHSPPDNHRVKTVCENNVLRLQCRPKSVLAIYSAHYGRFLRGKPECDAPNAGGPHIECLAPDALRRVSKKCHRKGNCTVAADWATFGDPCLPGTKKQLRVSYTCVPKQLLEEAGPDTSDPFVLSDYMHGGWYKGPRFSRLREDRMIFTSSLTAFAQLWDVPEKVGLYFLCGVSAGLALLLCILSPKAAFLREAREALQGPGSGSEPGRTKLRDEQDEDLPDDSSSDSSFRRLTRTYRATDSIFGPELTAAMEGAAEQQGCGGEEIWMPKESSPYAIQKIKSATKE